MMIRNKKLLYKGGLLIAVLVAMVASCRKDEGPQYEYLVTADFVASFNVGYIDNMLNIAESSYPEIGELKQYLVNGIDIYRIVYKTEVNNEAIKASGLVCVPSSAGEYPVICFQNGTNTVNAYAPSEYPLNPLYQMAEAVSSFGYIMVIPDYPGFGESSGIPHPYLITEPTVRSITDMLYAVREFGAGELTDVDVRNEYYLMGYSQGGWATLCLHKAIEQDFSGDFDLRGSVCGAGPYNLTLLFNTIINAATYPMPVYIGYIINAYTAYHQFTNPVSDILNEPYASNLSSLYNGLLTAGEINSQLTATIQDLFTPAFLSGFDAAPQYSSVREAMVTNSVAAWKTEIPLLLIHGGSDNTVNPITTENMYTEMLTAGTAAQVIKKELIPGADHGEGVVQSMVSGLKFIRSIQGI